MGGDLLHRMQICVRHRFAMAENPVFFSLAKIMQEKDVEWVREQAKVRKPFFPFFSMVLSICLR
jgi:hypothetical protein